MRHSMMSSFAATEETIEEEEEGIPFCLMQSIETAWNPNYMQSQIHVNGTNSKLLQQSDDKSIYCCRVYMDWEGETGSCLGLQEVEVPPVYFTQGWSVGKCYLPQRGQCNKCGTEQKGTLQSFSPKNTLFQIFAYLSRNLYCLFKWYKCMRQKKALIFGFWCTYTLYIHKCNKTWNNRVLSVSYWVIFVFKYMLLTLKVEILLLHVSEFVYWSAQYKVLLTWIFYLPDCRYSSSLYCWPILSTPLFPQNSSTRGRGMMIAPSPGQWWQWRSRTQRTEPPTTGAWRS